MAIDLKTILADGELLIRSGADPDGVTKAALAADSAFSGTYIAKSSVTGATVSASETTTSDTFTDLTTSGPAVTVTTGTAALVYLGAAIDNDNSAGTSLMGFAVSGATTIAASIPDSVSQKGLDELRIGGWFLVTLTAGSNTFTAKYRRATGTAEFGGRRIIVIPL
jgi:hypothetical protein